MSSLTYVYCLVRAARRPSMRGVPGRMPGAAPARALAAGDGLWAVVSNVPASDYDEAALAKGLQDLEWVGGRAMAHEAVVEHFLTAAAVLPMQLFTLFTSDERALAFVASDRARIDRILTRVGRQLEWGLRLSFDEKAARSAVEERSGTPAPSGSAYLARKRDLFGLSRAQLAAAREEADRLYRAMARAATDARRRAATEHAASGSRLLLDAAFLVPTRRAGAFRSALRLQTRRLTAPGVVVSLTGPWPPYNFITTAARPRGTRTIGRARPPQKAAAGRGRRTARR